jgi:hypothetical protein
MEKEKLWKNNGIIFFIKKPFKMKKNNHLKKK